MKERMAQPYAYSVEHLRHELRWLDLLLHRDVLLFRRYQMREQETGLGALFVSDGEIDRLLETMNGEEAADDRTPHRVEELARAAAELRLEIEARRQATAESGVFLALPHLAHLFGLTPTEELVLLICLAPEVEAAYERLYAYLQNDLTKRKPSIDLVFRLLGREPDSRISLRSLFSPLAPLFRHHLIEHPETDNGGGLPDRMLKLDARIAGYLLQSSGMSSDAAACLNSVAPPRAPVLSVRDETLLSQVSATAAQHLGAGGPDRKLIVHAHGPAGVGKKSFAAIVCEKLGVSLMVVDLREVLRRRPGAEAFIRVILRECLLQPTAVYLDHFDAVAGDEEQARSVRRALVKAIEEFSWLTFIGAEKEWKPCGQLRQHVFLPVALPLPGVETRVRLWESLAADVIGCVEDLPLVEAATTFKFTAGQIWNALQSARNAALLRDDQGVVTVEDLVQGCRVQSAHRLGTLARKLEPRATWSEIILPEDSLQHLREICAQVKHRRTVYSTWGFAKRLSLGKGLCVLFSGPSGTGKTLAVEVIANELRLEAYKVDLSTVVSKYIGETEKNLSKVFEEAESSNAILFFDEADALFGKRSEVKDAHDRYANIEINYLLQRIEEFDGLVILASNLRKNIDEAFFRRMHFAVEFPFPDAAYRYRIWQQHIPPEAPLADDIDFNFLANRCALTGGNIRNIVVNAAFLAAENSGVIHMEHVVRAIRREYEKIGKMCTEAEFGPYHAMVTER